MKLFKRTEPTTTACSRSISSHWNNLGSLPILIVGLAAAALISTTLQNPIATNSPSVVLEQRSDGEMARFNRRFIQINDYLFNGIEKKTAIA